ncbi:hypothetical protein FIU89_03230 [Roseovarius sp. THAF27]|uniref:hypothetical protein n=1 Tax=Roseovarius sp. THAF27 TaxID=2587850 RepID=UPI0012684638|nr:hypothetical protein [Roseovarius sp. THAF27]QFT79611.1 hypothetical protein FIU89_03230 [Roseovarius sp. THAF27]
MKTTLTSALAIAALVSAPVATFAANDEATNAEADASVSAQAGDVAQEVGDTIYAIGESTTDTAQAGVDAVGGVAEDAYDAASDISTELDAALTGDAKVYTSDGELVGTYNDADSQGNIAVVDLDGEMEGADDRAIERAGIPLNALMVGDDGVTVNMTKAEFETALKANARTSSGG